MSENNAAITQNTYNRAAKDWIVGHNDPGYWLTEFKIFEKLLPKGKVLDIGCGYGRDCPLFLSRGYNYIGLDYSEGFLLEARRLLSQAKIPLDAKFVMADMREMPFRDNSFDGFWASASFLHIEKSEIMKVLNDVKRITRNNAIGFISLKKGAGEGIVINNSHAHGWSVEDRRFFAYYERREFERILMNCGFRVLEFSEHKRGFNTTWLKFFVEVEK